MHAGRQRKCSESALKLKKNNNRKNRERHIDVEELRGREESESAEPISL